MKTKRILFITIFVVLLSFAIYVVTAMRAPLYPPTLNVSLITEGEAVQHIQAKQLSSEWIIPMRGSFVATTDPTLIFWTWDDWDFSGSILYLGNENGKIELHFYNNFTPRTIYARRWRAELVGSDTDMSLQYQVVEISNNRTIHVNTDSHDYIYEIKAVWSQGHSLYTFRVTRRN